MRTEDENKNIDRLTGSAMKDSGMPSMPASFTDRFMQRLLNRLAWKEIMAEFAWKAALVMVLLVFAAAVFFIPRFSHFLKIFTGLSATWQLLFYPAILIVFILVVDQVLLKYMIIRKKQ